MKTKVTVSPATGTRFNVTRTDFSLYRVFSKPGVRI